MTAKLNVLFEKESKVEERKKGMRLATLMQGRSLQVLVKREKWHGAELTDLMLTATSGVK